ncbi:NAD(P)-binding domain-containing protein [Acidiphilium sp.]|uniref:NAD(P)-binding domain-containing protein n=1 Tax=Acidiphilium sp. TaxID=527 RepID=UPI003CFD8B84
MNFTVAIVGAGPYGLSLAAHLNALGIDHCVFGPPMTFWAENMPPGTKLKSDGQSSDLSAPDTGFSFGRYQTETTGQFNVTQPITVGEFHAYGMAFRKRLVSSADQRMVADIRRDGAGFILTLADGEMIGAKAVVIAVGVKSFANLPPALAALSPDLVSHSVVYGPVDTLRGKRVAVIGAGASAIDVAASLHEAGIDTRIVTRRAGIAFHHPPGRRKLRHRVRRPDSGIGGGWDLWIYANYPGMFHMLPEATRLRLVQQTLGAAPGWFMRERIEGQVPILAGMTTNAITTDAGVITLEMTGADGADRKVEVDHIVAATGFWPDVRRLDILDPGLIATIRTADAAPVLSRRFETSVPGLYMIGPAAAPSFGPVMRFVYGARSTAPVLARYLASRHPRAAKVATSKSPGSVVAYPQPGE